MMPVNLPGFATLKLTQGWHAYQANAFPTPDTPPPTPRPYGSKIAVDSTVVHQPFLWPTADWVMFMVRTILFEMR